MLVKQVMTKGAECIRPDATLDVAAERMKLLDIGALPVCDNDNLVGMLTDRDIAIRCVSEHHDPREDHVSDVMSHDVYYCFEDEDVADASKRMQEQQIRRLPVLNRKKRLTGFVSLADLALKTGDEKHVGETLESISERRVSGW